MQEQWRKAEKAEDPEHAEWGGEQAVHEQEKGLQRWNPQKKQALTCLQRPRLFWNPVGGGSIYPVVPGPDKVHNTGEPEREQRLPCAQKQTLLSTKQAEASEAEKVDHDEAEEWQIRRWRSRSCREKMSEATPGFQGTLQGQSQGNCKQLQRQRGQNHSLELLSILTEPRAGEGPNLNQPHWNIEQL